MSQARCPSTRKMLGAIIHCQGYIGHGDYHHNGIYDWSQISFGILNPDLTPIYTTEREKQMANRGIVPRERPVFDTKDVSATALDLDELKFLGKYAKDQREYLDGLTLKQARELNQHLDRELELLDNKKRAILAAKHTIEENFRGN